MKTNKLMVSLVAFFVAIFAISYAMAGTLPVTFNEVAVNDVVLSGSNVLAGMPSETVPVVVKFTASADVQDMKLKVWIDGYKNEISASTDRFNVVNGSTYIKRLSLTLPSVNDMDNLNEGLTFYIRASDKNNEKESSYSIKMQRESYEHSVLSVDAPQKAAAGEVIALDVVLKNIGTYTLDDSFVTATISELGVQRKAYFGDLAAQDNCTNNCDRQDARERRIYLVIPSDAKSGDYTLEVKASNYDSSETVKKAISITGLAVSDDGKSVIDANKKDSKIPTSIIILTVVLVIVFVVLLVVLIVLLTKKPSEKTEDFGETSYY
jgi:hypothetical protein